MKRFEPYREDDDYDVNKMIPVEIAKLSNLGFTIVFDPPVEFLLYEKPDDNRLKTLAIEVLTSMGYELDEQGIEPSISQETYYTVDELDNLGIFEFDDEIGFQDCYYCDREIEIPNSLMFHKIKCSYCGEIVEIEPSRIGISRNLTRFTDKEDRRN